MPKSHRNFWKEKFKKNVNRDRKKEKELIELGWKVCVIWECEINNDIMNCYYKILEYVKNQKIDLKNFYIRRILRLFPALVLLLVIFSIASWIYLDNITAKSNLIDSLIALFYFSNWARAFVAGW